MLNLYLNIINEENVTTFSYPINSSLTIPDAINQYSISIEGSTKRSNLINIVANLTQPTTNSSMGDDVYITYNYTTPDLYKKEFILQSINTITKHYLSFEQTIEWITKYLNDYKKRRAKLPS